MQQSRVLGTTLGLTPIGSSSRVNFFANGVKEPWYLGFVKAVSKVLDRLSGCGCFDDDTPILTKDGYKRIVDIQVGDLVLARNEENAEIAYKPVSRVFVVPNRRIYLLTVEDAQGKRTVIEVSDDHPFWVVGKKWIHSIDLKEGDQLLDSSNQVLKFISLTETDRVETTYNLEVEGYHTYFAGDANVWVHNIDCFKPGWIKKDLYSNLSKNVKNGDLDPSTLRKFEEALKSTTSGQGGTGMKYLRNGERIGNMTYHYEIKIQGRGGNARIYGNVNDKGQIIFSVFKDSH